MPVVGWLNRQPLATGRWLLDGFRKGLGEAGFVEGKNVMIALRPGDGKRATQSIPIMFTSGADPVRIGLVSSYNQPGGNVAGVHIQYSQLVGKRLALLHEAVPKAKRFAVLFNPAHPADAEPTVKNATAISRALGLDVQVFNARSADDHR